MAKESVTLIPMKTCAERVSYLTDDVDEENEINKLKEELQQQKDKYLRLVAEFDNFKKEPPVRKNRIDRKQQAEKSLLLAWTLLMMLTARKNNFKTVMILHK